MDNTSFAAQMGELFAVILSLKVHNLYFMWYYFLFKLALTSFFGFIFIHNKRCCWSQICDEKCLFLFVATDSCDDMLWPC